jgi:hypothetical protein
MQAISSATDSPNNNTSASISASMNGNTATFNILPSAKLSIKMTIPTQAKSKKRTKYRPVERSDGVVVLQRPYRPATLPTPATLKFEKHLPTFAAPVCKTPPQEAAAMARRDEDFAHIGANFREARDVDSDDLVDAGRGGYNDRNGRIEVRAGHGLPDFMKKLRRVKGNCQSTPMQQFLSEAGPWSPFESSKI